MFMRKTIPLLLFVVSLPLRAQTPYLVKDINTTYSNATKSSSPTEFVAFGNRTFFAATTDASGTELWSTDGTSNGTAMVADIIPGSGSSNPGGLTVVNGVLLFNARDVNHGIELWASDGTAAGTRLLVDVNPGPTSSQPGSRIVYKNKMLFSADDGTNGRELWITDGTVAGTRMLKDINPGSAASAPTNFVTMGDSVYFLAGGNLWKTDGTESGTLNVATVFSRNLAVAGSQLFFEGFTAVANWEPWVSDGTNAGTRMVADILPGTNGSLDSDYGRLGFTPFGSQVLFLANDGIHGREMWISDGTAAGTRMVRDVVPGAVGMWDSGFAYITVLGSRAFFSASDAEHGQEMWVTDGTDAGTALFADLTPGTASSNAYDFVVSGGKLFFVAGEDFETGSHLWVTDGSVTGTHRLGGAGGLGLALNIVPALRPINGNVYFAGVTGLTGGEPWVTDGTDAGTRMIANLGADRAPSSFPSGLTAAGNLLFFSVIEGTFSPTTNIPESSLWRSDGTAAGTFKLLETGQHPGGLMAAGPLVFFSYLGSSSTLLVSDGTVAGTKSADDFLRRFGQSGGIETFFPFGDTLFAAVYDPYRIDSTLWKTSGAPDAAATPLGALNPTGLTEVSGHYLFYAQGFANVYNYDWGLWTTDGTPAGTYAIVPDLGQTGSTPGKLVNAAGTVFFLKVLHNENIKLWKSDGTMDGTVIVKELPYTDTITFELEMKAAGHRVFFTFGSALWSSDGTESGTAQIATVKFYPSITNDNLRPVGNRIVFIQYDGVGTFELWGSDGTKEGTIPLLNLAGSSSELTNIDGTVYFAGTDDQHGTELWTTDGTVGGTKLLVDLNPGPASSYPYGFTKAGNLLYFSGYTDATGGELWALPLTTPSLSISDTRVAEGDAGTTMAHFNVSLTPAATQSVTVDYVTSDGTASAGNDYDAASGTLTFAPGETATTIDVRVRGDVLPENNETFFVTLRNVSGASVIKGEAVGIIEDDDQTADIGIVSQFSEDSANLRSAVSVSNNGPRTATELAVSFTATPTDGRPFGVCFTCSFPQLAAGASALASSDYRLPPQQAFMSATATARQRDPQSSNNTTTWTVNGQSTMAMNAAYLPTGATGTVTAKFFTQNPVVTSSDPTVVSAPSTLTKVTAGLGTFTVTGLKPGTSTINVDAQQYPLAVTVVAPGTQPRWPGGVTIATDTTLTRFDRATTVTVTPSGTAPLSGARATGTVLVTSAGQELARAVVNGTGSVLSLPVYLPSLGQIQYAVTYSGDTNFQPQSVNTTVFVQNGQVTMTGGLERVPGSAGTFTLTVHATGSPLASPTGTLSVVNGGVEVARVTLVPSGGGTSTAHVTIANLPPSPTLTINYAGDALYQSGSQQVRLVETRRRSAGH
jgi:ELWxxDGT repeat protein